MPVYSRRTLRQALGQSFLNDTILSTTNGTGNLNAVGGAFWNAGQFADTSLTNQNLYENATIEHHAIGAASGQDFDYRVSSFNTASGAFVTSMILQATISSGDSFEVHSRLEPGLKDLAIDDAIKRIRVRQEVGIMTGTAGLEYVSLEGAASPHYISRVEDAYYFASPLGSLFRDRRRLTDYEVVMTGSGREIRTDPILSGTQQLVIDAILELTLGASDFATVNIPDDRWVLAGAAAKAYDLSSLHAVMSAAAVCPARSSSSVKWW